MEFKEKVVVVTGWANTQGMCDAAWRTVNRD